jgi:hypothetical protein
MRVHKETKAEVEAYLVSEFSEKNPEEVLRAFHWAFLNQRTQRERVEEAGFHSSKEGSRGY